MDVTPSAVQQAEFRTTRKGYDPDQVRSYLAEVARALEAAQQQSSAMEARARAALAKLQEQSQVAPAPDQSGEISRTLLLAQRAADEARAEADRDATAVRAEAQAAAAAALAAAQAEAASLVDEARATATHLVETARLESRRARDEEHLAAENAVQALLARREFLLADVESLEQHVITHRERLRDLASSLVDMAERGPHGLGDLRRPVLSASDAALPFNDSDAPPAGAAQDSALFTADDAG